MITKDQIWRACGRGRKKKIDSCFVFPIFCFSLLNGTEYVGNFGKSVLGKSEMLLLKERDRQHHNKFTNECIRIWELNSVSGCLRVWIRTSTIFNLIENCKYKYAEDFGWIWICVALIGNTEWDSRIGTSAIAALPLDSGTNAIVSTQIDLWICTCVWCHFHIIIPLSRSGCGKSCVHAGGRDGIGKLNRSIRHAKVYEHRAITHIVAEELSAPPTFPLFISVGICLEKSIWVEGRCDLPVKNDVSIRKLLNIVVLLIRSEIRLHR